MVIPVEIVKIGTRKHVAALAGDPLQDLGFQFGRALRDLVRRSGLLNSTSALYELGLYRISIRHLPVAVIKFGDPDFEA